MRLVRNLLLVLMALVWAAPPSSAGEAEIRGHARAQGLVDVAGFVDAVVTVRQRSKLPDRFLTKAEAQKLGWRPGEDLCDSARGRSIGGDRFGNRERRLPEKKGRKYFEADLDFACGKRGPKRLVWSDDGLMFTTVDHYDSFQQVPK